LTKQINAAPPCFAHLFECSVYTKKCKAAAAAAAAMMLLQSNTNLMAGAAEY
jgi:hypothetical protein